MVRENVFAHPDLLASPKSFKELIDARQLPAWIEFIGVDVGRGSLLQVDRYKADQIHEQTRPARDQLRRELEALLDR
jgi:hypothetical protein